MLTWLHIAPILVNAAPLLLGKGWAADDQGGGGSFIEAIVGQRVPSPLLASPPKEASALGGAGSGV